MKRLRKYFLFLVEIEYLIRIGYWLENVDHLAIGCRDRGIENFYVEHIEIGCEPSIYLFADLFTQSVRAFIHVLLTKCAVCH